MQSVSQYLYGSSVRVLEDGRVLYENQFMPSGTVIHEWYSKANYQDLRNTSQLPDLKRGEKYVIGSYLETLPENSTYLKVIFIDSADEEIFSHSVKPEEIASVYVPTDTHHYKIQLVSGGCQRFLFEGIYIAQEGVADYTVARYWISDLLHKDNEKNTIYVCFTEPDLNRTGFVPERVQKHFSNLVMVNSSYKDALLYMEKDFFRILLEKIEDLSGHYAFEKVAFIGYGPISNIAALFYSKQFSTSYALVTDNFLAELDYHRLLERHRKRVNYPIFRDLLLYRFDSTRVKKFASLKIETQELFNFVYLLNQSVLLQNIDLETTEEWMRRNIN
ncbi:accessory Sec system protein Asp3 [Streptococcus oralis]|uniref:accessory Sec system protein Asp3 n=1 Tax=Streptococcus oralis TaxID=1303 RepID=UPI002024941F|nr:accessory Sec system protein Asp3 [Streptococcus oralis]URK68301.1 accessory Sec system protein Asp3 [Streptococcus oralis]